MSVVERKRLVVGVSGASGAIYAKHLLEYLATLEELEIHFVASEPGWQVLAYETGWTKDDVAKYVDQIHDIDNIGASIASGSFRCSGMVILPCSMKTVGSLASGCADNLLSRAADVTLKEGRKLVLVVRETPLHGIHLENMLKLSRVGATILPACPGFYHRPQTIDELVDMLVGKIIDNLNLPSNSFKRWGE